jgi:hypothetical protein
MSGRLTVVTLGFDDGTAGHFDVVRPVLAEHGMRGVFFVITGRLGQPGYMTAEQVRQLHDEGHEIGGHTVNHLHLIQLSAEDQVREVRHNEEYLQVLLGIKPSVVSFAYPFGEWDPGVAKLVETVGYTSARIVGGIASTGLVSPLPSAIGLPVPRTQRYVLPTPGSVRRHHKAADLQRLVETAEQVGGWLQLVFHRIDLVEPVYGFDPVEFEAFLAWLALREADGTVVRLTRDVVGALSS